MICQLRRYCAALQESPRRQAGTEVSGAGAAGFSDMILLRTAHVMQEPDGAGADYRNYGGYREDADIKKI